jgi:hypothetical protein
LENQFEHGEICRFFGLNLEFRAHLMTVGLGGKKEQHARGIPQGKAHIAALITRLSAAYPIASHE